MQKESLKLVAFIILIVSGLWLLINGEFLSAVAGLLLAGVIPGVSFVIPAWVMLIFWALSGAILLYTLSYPRTKRMGGKTVRMNRYLSIKRSTKKPSNLKKRVVRTRSSKRFAKA